MSKRKFGEIDEDEEINNQIRDKINKKISLGTENKKKLYANLQKYINYFILNAMCQEYIYINCTSGSIQKNINMDLFYKLI